MTKWATIFLFFLTTYCKGQFNGLYTDFGYQTNFSQQNINFNLTYEFKPVIDSMYKLLAVGAGGEYFFDNQFLFDVKASVALRQQWVCHVYWNERFMTWFLSMHYKFSPQFDRQVICPEFGYNFWTNSRFFLTPSINYYLDLKTSDDRLKQFYLAFKIKFLLSSGRFRP